MDKLKVLVGLVYTQLMFCDEKGKLHFHRVMTDLNRPWLSIKELLRMLKQALSMDKPMNQNFRIQFIHIDLQYQNMNFTSLLETLRAEMERSLSEGCQVFIQTCKDYYAKIEESTGEKVDWKTSAWEYDPLEAIDRNEEELGIIQAYWIEKEWQVPFINTEQEISLHSVESYEPMKKRIGNFGWMVEDRRDLFAVGRGPSNGKKVNHLRGSPNGRHSYIWKEGVGT